MRSTLYLVGCSIIYLTWAATSLFILHRRDDVWPQLGYLAMLAFPLICPPLLRWMYPSR